MCLQRTTTAGGNNGTTGSTNEAASTAETEEISAKPETTDTETVTRAIDALRDVYHVDAEVVAVQKQSIVLVDEKDTTHS